MAYPDNPEVASSYSFQIYEQTHLQSIKISFSNRGRFVEQKLLLSCSFRCDQIHNNNIYEFCHTLLCCQRWTWMFNKPTSGFLGQFVECLGWT
jgi:hypothetical protein